MIYKENKGSMSRLIAGPGSSVFLYLEGIEFSNLVQLNICLCKTATQGLKQHIVYSPPPLSPLKKTSETEEICLRVKSDFFYFTAIEFIIVILLVSFLVSSTEKQTQRFKLKYL